MPPFRVDAQRSERLEHPVSPAVVGGDGAARLTVAAPEQTKFQAAALSASTGATSAARRLTARVSRRDDRFSAFHHAGKAAFILVPLFRVPQTLEFPSGLPI
jgi:hypothetical protein